MNIGILTSDPSMSNFFLHTLEEYRSRRYAGACCSAVTSLMQFYAMDCLFDLIFIDEGFEHRSALETARLLRSRDEDVALVLLSSTPDGVFESFSVKALRFLVKPITQSAVFTAVDACRREKFSYRIIITRTAEGYRSFRSEEIYAAEANGKGTCIQTRSSLLPVLSAFADVRAQLPEEYFFSVHRSFTINMQYVSAFNGEQVELENGVCLPLSRRRKGEFYRPMSSSSRATASRRRRFDSLRARHYNLTSFPERV